MISLIIVTLVFISIAVRQIGNIRLQIWQIMTLGAFAVLLTGQLSLYNALAAVNMDVLLFLWGMFIIGQALEESGYLAHLSYRLFKKARCTDHLVLFILFGMGTASAFLMNDTLAIIGTPVVLLLAKKHHISPKLLLLTLAFAVTIGSVFSPIGNPQNLLIAMHGNVNNTFLTFFSFLLFPSLLNLFLTYLLLKRVYGIHFHKEILDHSQEPIKDHQLAELSKIALLLVISLVLIKMSALSFALPFDFRLTFIALVGALPILFSAKRWQILRKIDWETLLFFAAMFILMESVWRSGFFQSMISGTSILTLPMILLVSILLSQLISNVPLVALYLPILLHAGASTKEMMALAAGSTIAGNLFILGAASNIIIIQNAEKKAGETITFWEFAYIGIPLTLINATVYWLFLVIIV